MRKRQTLILSLLLVVFLLGGCAEKEVADIAEKETTKEAVEEAVEDTAQDTDQEEVLQEKQEKFAEAQSRYKKSNTERIEAEEILESCRAGILAERLIEGRKCPVCGSLHHPDPARLPDKSVSEDEVKSLRLAEEKEVPVEIYPLLHYKCCGIIKKVADA